ncbi:site-specific DNA-methyltransferase [Enterobacter huaxiensis]|uniref:site-specific DNA-methyltransferase n=1 Tax=Enterobacter huaxiensis TaxID=2494702 RepID=UPI0021D87D2B|nr:site-specific DNA-methyltransferase [Enterobacter huaxiensis]
MANERITEHSSEQKGNAEPSYSIDALPERRQDESCSPLSDISKDLFDIPSTTPNFRTELAGHLAELLPEVVADGKLDVEKLLELLADDAADSNERFGLFWPGKKRALRAAQAPTTATLKPDLVNSKEWDTTQNAFIEGDNLEVLKILQRYYHNKVKLIYIDPPYNTGKDFVYPDNYKDGLYSYLEWTRQVNDEGKKVSTNNESEGRYHSNWLNMMYPRLKLARNLLTDDGAIFISIDDSEMENLKRLANEVFGESNFVGTMIWAAGRKNDSKYVSASHEYIFCYARNLAYMKEHGVTWKVKKKGLDAIQAQYAKLRKMHGANHMAVEQGLRSWYVNLPDSDPSKRHKHYSSVDARGIFFPSDLRKPAPTSRSRYDILHPVTKRPVNMHPNGWSFAPEQMNVLLAEDRIKFGVDEKTRPTLKVYIEEANNEAAYSVFYQDGRASSKRLNSLMGGDVFDFPKDEFVIQSLVEMVTSEGDIILDFFAGSATTAHAVMQLNAEDNGKRRFIMVQLPEPTPEGSEARKAGYATIADISRKRIELAGEKIKSDAVESHLDTGFRAYKLTDTNFTKWRVTSDIEPDKITQHLLDLRDSSTNDASPDDLLTELLLKLGYSLSEPLSTQVIAGLDVLTITGDAEKPRLLAYLNERIKPTLEQFRELVNTEPTRLIILEDAFHGDDELKTNIAQYARSKGIELRTA